MPKKKLINAPAEDGHDRSDKEGSWCCVLESSVHHSG